MTSEEQIWKTKRLTFVEEFTYEKTKTDSTPQKNPYLKNTKATQFRRRIHIWKTKKQQLSFTEESIFEKHKKRLHIWKTQKRFNFAEVSIFEKQKKNDLLLKKNPYLKNTKNPLNFTEESIFQTHKTRLTFKESIFEKHKNRFNFAEESIFEKHKNGSISQTQLFW